MQLWLDAGVLSLPKLLTSAGQARRFVADALSGVPCPDLVDTAVLLTSELVARAVLQGAEPVTLRIFGLGGVVRIEVADGGVPATRGASALAWARSTESGRGLLLVEALAADWGSLPHQHADHGQTSWFELNVA